MKASKESTIFGFLAVTGVIVCVYGYVTLFSVPNMFPVGKNFTVGEHETLKSISTRLQQEGYVRSALFFRAGISFLGKDRVIHVGGYVFSSPVSLLDIINVFSKGQPTVPLLSVTIPEGSTSGEVASILSKSFPSISSDTFRILIAKYQAEGKLFPSTYFLLPSYTEEDIIKIMLTTFSKKIGSTLIKASDIKPPLTSENDVLVLASILEGEAKTPEDMAIVSGILQARLTKGMPLQVDVAKETYTKKGLPTTPINNPGIVAVQSALHPTLTQYLYYITGNDGAMHYAVSFTEHKKNIAKYLR